MSIFSEILRFMTETNNAAGFRSEYRGIVYVDVGKWREHFEEKHFVSFMEYLSDNSDDWLVVLSISDDKQEQIQQMESELKDESVDMLCRLDILAKTYIELHEYEKEVQERTQIYHISCRLFGEDHVITRQQLTKLADTYYYIADYKKALELMEKAYAQSCKTVGEENPEAIEKYKKVVALRNVLKI